MVLDAAGETWLANTSKQPPIIVQSPSQTPFGEFIDSTVPSPVSPVFQNYTPVDAYAFHFCYTCNQLCPDSDICQTIIILSCNLVLGSHYVCRNLRKFRDLKKVFTFCDINFFHNTEKEMHTGRVILKKAQPRNRFLYSAQNFFENVGTFWGSYLHHIFTLFFSQIILHHYSTTYMYMKSRTHVHYYFVCCIH